MSKNFKVKNGLETTNITASANVSSSGAIIGNEITASGLNLVGSGTAELEVQGNITASGNISGSLTSTGSFGHIKIDGTNIKTFISSSAAADGFGGGGGSGVSSYDDLTDVPSGIFSSSLQTFTNITASGDISASGALIGNSALIDNINIGSNNIHSTKGSSDSNTKINIGASNHTLEFFVRGVGGDAQSVASYVGSSGGSSVIYNIDSKNMSYNILSSGSSGAVAADDASVLLNCSANSNLVGIGRNVTTLDSTGAILQVGGSISASGDITASNISITTASIGRVEATTFEATNLVGTLTTAAQTNITSLGTLTTLTVDNVTINGSTIEGSGAITFGKSAQPTTIKGTSVTIDANADITLDAAGDQVFFKDNDTTSVTVNTAAGHITASGNISASGQITASAFKGDGAGLSNVSATLPSGVYSSSLQTLGNITSSGNISASGTITADRVDVTNSAGIYADKIRRYSDSDTTTKIVLNDEIIKVHAGHSSNESINVQLNEVTITPPITASGNISSSGTANTFGGTSTFGGNTTINGHIFLADMIKHVGATNNSIGFAGTNVIQLNTDDRIDFTTDVSTGGSIKLRIDSAGANFANGHITASGNISASSTSTLSMGGQATLGGINSTSHITASGNISGSGLVSISGFQDLNLTRELSTPSITTTGDVSIGGSITTNITASNNISASGTIFGTDIKSDGTSVVKSVTQIADSVAQQGRITFVDTAGFSTTKNISNLGSTDNPTFNHITASGNISSSGYVQTDTIYGSDNYLNFKNDTSNPSELRLYCQANSHYLGIRGPEHSGASSYVIKLPNDVPSDNQILKVSGTPSGTPEEVTLAWESDGGGGGGVSFPTTEVVSSSNALFIGEVDGAFVSASNGTLEISGSGTAELEVQGNISASGDITSNTLNVNTSGELTGSYGTLHGAFNINYGNATTFSASLASAGDGYGEIISHLRINAASAGDVVYHNGVDWRGALANDENKSNGLLGVALADGGPIGVGGPVLIRGMVRLGAGHIADTSGIEGDPLYLSTTSGHVQFAVPGSGNFARIVGYCMDETNDIIYFNPGTTFVEVS